MEIQVIARIHTEFPEKFGIPRQSGLADTVGTIVFEPAYRQPEALRGIEEYSHIWLLWGFSDAERDEWSATVRPPRLGGNTRMGVFATRSPFRPNAIGLSSVRLAGVRRDERLGTVLDVVGADLKDGTPIYDIKPYLPYTDSHPDAVFGFAERAMGHRLDVTMPEQCRDLMPPQVVDRLIAVLAQDPRPSYQNDPERVYGMDFAGWRVRFTVDGDQLTVMQTERI